MRPGSGGLRVVRPVPREVWESVLGSDRDAAVTQSLAWRDAPRDRRLPGIKEKFGAGLHFTHELYAERQPHQDRPAREYVADPALSS
jgi:hypothetical protein